MHCTADDYDPGALYLYDHLVLRIANLGKTISTSGRPATPHAGYSFRNRRCSDRSFRQRQSQRRRCSDRSGRLVSFSLNSQKRQSDYHLSRFFLGSNSRDHLLSQLMVKPPPSTEQLPRIPAVLRSPRMHVEAPQKRPGALHQQGGETAHQCSCRLE